MPPVSAVMKTLTGTYPGIFVLIHKTPTIYHLAVMISNKA